MTEDKLSSVRLLLLEVLLNRGKAIPEGVPEPGIRAIHMFNFVDEKIKDAIRTIDDLIQSSASRAIK